MLSLSTYFFFFRQKSNLQQNKMNSNWTMLIKISKRFEKLIMKKIPAGI